MGHGIDPLRSSLAPMSPRLFIDVVSGLLSAHDFRLDGSTASIQSSLSLDGPTVLHGKLYLTYEWVLAMTTEFGFDEGSDFRIEGAPFHAQGDILMVVDPTGQATLTSLGVDIVATAKSLGVGRVLVISNTHFKPAHFGQWSGGLRERGLECQPQDLSSLAFNVLTTTNVYLHFHDRLDFEYIHYR